MMSGTVNYRGKLSSAGETVVSDGNRLNRIWRPILRIERPNPGPNERQEQNVSLLMGSWFLGRPIEEHAVEVVGTWHAGGAGGYLDVAEYTDTNTAARFSRQAGPLTDVDLPGRITEWKDLTIIGRDTAFTFILFDEKTDTSHTVAFRGDVKQGTGWLADGVDVQVRGGRDASGVVIPREITFPNDPLMEPWTDRPATVQRLAAVLAYFLLLAFAVGPWIGMNLDTGLSDPFFDAAEEAARRAMLPFLVAWSCLMGVLIVAYTVLLLRFGTRRGRHPAL